MSIALLSDQENHPTRWNRIQDQELLSELLYPLAFTSCYLPYVPCSSEFGTQDSSSIPNITAKELSTQSRNFLTELLDLTRLGVDWDSYGSPAPTIEFVNDVICLLSKANVLEIPDIQVFPISGGGIQFEWSAGNQEVEIAFFPNDTGNYLITTETGEVVHEGTFNLALAVPILRFISLRTSY